MASSKVTSDEITAGPVFSYAFTGTAASTSAPMDIRNYDGVSLHLIVDYQADPVSVAAASDNIVASTKTFTFANYDFTGLTGAKIQISGAANAGNNSTFVISSVTSAHVVVCTTASGLVNETFANGVVVNVIRSEAASVPAGTWDVLGSNDFSTKTSSSPAQAGAYGMAGNLGHFPSVKALFASPAAIASVTDAGSQIVQPAGHCSIRHLKFVFTPSAGLGTARVCMYAKSWSR